MGHLGRKVCACRRKGVEFESTAPTRARTRFAEPATAVHECYLVSDFCYPLSVDTGCTAVAILSRGHCVIATMCSKSILSLQQCPDVAPAVFVLHETDVVCVVNLSCMFISRRCNYSAFSFACYAVSGRQPLSSPCEHVWFANPLPVGASQSRRHQIRQHKEIEPCCEYLDSFGYDAHIRRNVVTLKLQNVGHTCRSAARGTAHTRCGYTNVRDIFSLTPHTSHLAPPHLTALGWGMHRSGETGSSWVCCCC